MDCISNFLKVGWLACASFATTVFALAATTLESRDAFEWMIFVKLLLGGMTVVTVAAWIMQGIFWSKGTASQITVIIILWDCFGTAFIILVDCLMSLAMHPDTVLFLLSHMAGFIFCLLEDNEDHTNLDAGHKSKSSNDDASEAALNELKEDGESEAISESTTEDRLQRHPLHPAAGVLLDRILRDVAEENDRIAKVNSQREALRDFLGAIELHLNNGHTISSSLSHASIVNAFKGGTHYVHVPFDCGPLPLTNSFGGSVTISGQVANHFSLRQVLVSRRDGSVRLRARLSQRAGFHQHDAIKGEIQGLGEDDFLRMRGMSGGGAGEELMRIITNSSSSITFMPTELLLLVTPDLRELLRFFNLPTFDTPKDYFKNKPLPLTRYSMKCPPMSPSDESRATILSAFGCNAYWATSLLDENRRLKDEQFILAQVEERLGTVEVGHAAGKFRLLLKDGELSEGEDGVYWRIPIQDEENRAVVMSCSDLFSVEFTLLGLGQRLGSIGMANTTDLFHVFRNGSRISSQADPESMQGMDEGGIVGHIYEQIHRALIGELGEQTPLSTATVKMVCVSIPIDSVQSVLDLMENL